MAPEVPHEERASGQAEEVDQRLARHRRRRARVEALLQVEEHVEQPEEDERAPRRDAGEHGPRAPADEADRRGGGRACRSEEHTSELQSRLHLVCRLLLEKINSTVPPVATVSRLA